MRDLSFFAWATYIVSAERSRSPTLREDASPTRMPVHHSSLSTIGTHGSVPDSATSSMRAISSSPTILGTKSFRTLTSPTGGTYESYPHLRSHRQSWRRATNLDWRVRPDSPARAAAISSARSLSMISGTRGSV